MNNHNINAEPGLVLFVLVFLSGRGLAVLAFLAYLWVPQLALAYSSVKVPGSVGQVYLLGIEWAARLSM
jgi:hypothetical protein